MKWYVYLICFALVVAGIFCGLRLHTLMTRESYINGSINIQNQFSMESFKYTSSSVEFYNDLYNNPNYYSFEKQLLRVDDFDGQRKQYQVVLNNYILTDVQIMAGSVFTRICLDFYGTDGDLKKSAYMDISVKFLSNKTELTFSTTGGENASFLSQYFNDYGIRLKINEIKGAK